LRLFDTDVLIEHLRGNERANELLESAFVDGRPAASVLSRFKLLAGMRPGERHAVRSLLDTLENLAVTEQIANRAGEWARSYRRVMRTSVRSTT
jgi:predicted nucleic acid-binding protein